MPLSPMSDAGSFGPASSDARIRELLRHTIATLAYRGAKALRGAPEGFSTLRVVPGARTPGEILTHITDLLEWAMSAVRGVERWRDSTPGAWSDDVARF